MTLPEQAPGSREHYHREHQARAMAEAQRLLAAREAVGGRWLGWVAAELYTQGPPHYVAMVRRALQRLSKQPG
ncbi:hypothetical protein IRZ81_21325 [Pseudomonas putida]|uniref:hypothetical protein n=1 Tax=Pseudomonas putida TaxID=303 RepID=UPI0018AC743A|nr:hypothetical protein [Pseudomonas putida]MBF8653317.1 hypothetical protein [Pseudomonas putida]MBF8657580.1 hypothetical protein [Pseudomonas putida]